MSGKVALIGMPGCGKTAIGREAARRGGRPFVDVDELIAELFGPIPELFLRGEPYFRRCEAEALRRAVRAEEAVIATGGGVVTQPGSMKILKAEALVIWIDRPIERIEADVDTASRPLLAGGAAALRALYRDRLPLYRRYADRVVANDGPLERACGEVLKAMKEGKL